MLRDHICRHAGHVEASIRHHLAGHAGHVGHHLAGHVEGKVRHNRLGVGRVLVWAQRTVHGQRLLHAGYEAGVAGYEAHGTRGEELGRVASKPSTVAEVTKRP